MAMLYQLWLFLLPVVLAHEFHLEYYVDVTMDCNDEGHNVSTQPVIVQRYWLFPDGQLYESSSNSTDHLTFNSTSSQLMIKRIDDADFGKYFCISVYDDHTISRVEHKLNVDGAYFGDLLEKYRRKAIVGGIAAGVLFALISSCCIFWQLRHTKRSRRNKAVDELDKAIDGYDLQAYDNIAITENVKEAPENGLAPDNTAEQESKLDGVTDFEPKM